MSPTKSTDFREKSHYSHAIKTARKFANGFSASEGYDIRKGYSVLTPYQRRKLKKYITVIDEQTARPFRVVRPRIPKRLRSLQEFSRQSVHLKGLKVAFIQMGDPSETLEIKYDKHDQILRTTEGGNIVRREIPFNRELLLTDPKAAAQDIILKSPEARRYILQAGPYEIPNSLAGDLRGLTQSIIRLQTKYGLDKYDATNPNSSYFGNWMGGVTAYTFRKTVSWQSYLQEKARVKRYYQELRSRKTSKKRKKQLMKKLEKYKLRSYKK